VIALDTNILIRLLVRDDPGQTALAERLLQEAADAGEQCFISDPVLCEALRSSPPDFWQKAAALREATRGRDVTEGAVLSRKDRDRDSRE